MDLVRGTYTSSRACEGHPVKPAGSKVFIPSKPVKLQVDASEVRSWSMHSPGWTPDCLRIKIPRSNRRALCTNRQRTSCGCVWLREIQSLCIW